VANRPLYIQLYHLHGLFRSRNLELGRDADTGGQTKYVLELAQWLGRHPDVGRVDVLTRRIEDARVDPDYARPVERISKKARIVRIRCGGRRYRRKELLWPHLDEFVDNCIRYIRGQKWIPDVVHGHYPDAGYVARHVAQLFGVPLVYTGHSLGRSKLARLTAAGMTPEEADKRYRIHRRIEAEENVLRRANLVVVSTRQEQTEQYGQYEAAPARIEVIPPGVGVDVFRPYTKSPRDRKHLEVRRALRQELERFHITRSKPLVLALSRPDKRKNIPALVHAYGSDRELQKLANLAIFAGIRKDIQQMPDNEREVLSELLHLMDRYDLYGHMAIPKRHDYDTEVPELYRIAARRRGVFVNPALTEPFGLTLIEAAASGLPVVSTNDGGPQEIIDKCRHGILIDPNDPEEIAHAIKTIIGDRDLWQRMSESGIAGVETHYTWRAHTRRYVEEIHGLVGKPQPFIVRSPREVPIGRRLHDVGRLLVTDIDDTLLGDAESLARLVALLERTQDRLAFGVATGRSVDSARQVLAEHGVTMPDVIISSVGAEIYLGDSDEWDRGWSRHIGAGWRREELAELLYGFEGLTLQENETQRPFKLSYYIDASVFDEKAMCERLKGCKCRYNAIISGERMFLDFLPYRASKGQAVRYVAFKWDIPPRQIMVAGDSGNDREMLTGGMRGVVVANHSPDLDGLRKPRRPYLHFSGESYAGGIIDGLLHHGFVDETEVSPPPLAMRARMATSGR